MWRSGAEALLPVLLAAAPALADEPPAPEPPSIELLEFLGSFATPDGDWLDPVQLAGDARGPAPPPAPEDDHD